MYVDLIVLILLIIAVVWFFRTFSSFVYLIAIIEIFLRILTFIKNNIGTNELSVFINKYFPENIFNIINNYTESTFNILLKWVFVIIMMIFWVYIVKYFFKKKK